MLISLPDLLYNNLCSGHHIIVKYNGQTSRRYLLCLPSVVMSRHEPALSLFIEIEKLAKQKRD